MILLQGFIDELAVAIRIIQETDKPAAAQPDSYTRQLQLKVEAMEKRLAALEKALAIKK